MFFQLICLGQVIFESFLGVFLRGVVLFCFTFGGFLWVIFCFCFEGGCLFVCLFIFVGWVLLRVCAGLCVVEVPCTFKYSCGKKIMRWPGLPQLCLLC